MLQPHLSIKSKSGGLSDESGPSDNAPRDNAIDLLEKQLLLTGIKERYGYDLEVFSTEFLDQNLKRCQKKLECSDPASFQNRLLREEGALESLLKLLFASPVLKSSVEKRLWSDFSKKVIPTLKTYPSLRFWCVGMNQSNRQHELAEKLDRAKLLERSSIYITDVNEGEIELARNKKSKGRLSYFKHHFLSDRSFNSFHAIFLNHSMENLLPWAREIVQALLFESLVPFGYLYSGYSDFFEQSPFKKHYSQLGEKSGWYQKKV